MSTTADFDHIARTWLQDGPVAMPDRSLQAALDEVHATPQRRFGAARRAIPLNGFALKLAAAAMAGLLVIVAIGAFSAFGPTGNVGGTPVATPVPTPSPSPTPIPVSLMTAGRRGPTSSIGRLRSRESRSRSGTVGASRAWKRTSWIWPSERPTRPCLVDAHARRRGLPGSVRGTSGPDRNTLGPSVDDLVTALTNVEGYDASAVTDVTIGGLPARSFVLTDAADTTCQPETLIGLADTVSHESGLDHALCRPGRGRTAPRDPERRALGIGAREGAGRVRDHDRRGDRHDHVPVGIDNSRTGRATPGSGIALPLRLRQWPTLVEAAVTERTIPILPCRSIDDVLAFYEALGFDVTYRQERPNTFAVVARGAIELQFFVLKELDPAASYSTCYVLTSDVDGLYEAFTAGSAGLDGPRPDPRDPPHRAGPRPVIRRPPVHRRRPRRQLHPDRPADRVAGAADGRDRGTARAGAGRRGDAGRLAERRRGRGEGPGLCVRRTIHRPPGRSRSARSCFGPTSRTAWRRRGCGRLPCGGPGDRARRRPGQGRPPTTCDGPRSWRSPSPNSCRVRDAPAIVLGP